MFRGTVALQEGDLTEKELHGKTWREIRPDIFVDARVGLDHSVACLAVAMLLPDFVCFSGVSAACLMGVTHAATYQDPVQLTVPRNVRVAVLDGVRVRHTEVPLCERDWVNGVQVTSVERTAWDLGSSLSTHDSVPIVDALLGLALVTPAELLRYAESRVSRRGGRTAMRAFNLADARARTPEASRLRLALMAAGLPRPTPHHPVTLGKRVRRPVLAWPEQRVGLVYPSDTTRYSDADWLVLRIDLDKIPAQLPTVIKEVRAALLGRGWQGQHTSGRDLSGRGGRSLSGRS